MFLDSPFEANANIHLEVIFAISAAVLVKHYSLYARHSGIPEIKTLLGGFVMQRFLGGWTLVTKSVGLVCTLSPHFCAFQLTFAVSCCCLWPLVGQRRTLCPSSLLLREHHHETI